MIPGARTVLPATPAAPVGPGLYLHIPFCGSVCPYCDFAVVRGGPARRTAFVRALRLEIERVAATHAARFAAPFDTIYLGGGTPSALAPTALAEVLEAVRNHLALTHEARFILEANPEDVDSGVTAQWRALGFSGVSLGVQSFHDVELRQLGRRHDGTRARHAVETVLSAGFAWVSLDLMYGLPGQTLPAWRENLRQALALGTPHLSCYQLTVHPDTPFARRAARGRLAPIDEHAEARFFTFTHEYLAAHGCPAYEVSNFARELAQRSAHNIKYWQHVPYLGLGPSAHSFDGRRRWWNVRDLRDYEARLAAGALPVADEEVLNHRQLALETILLGLRTTEGLDLAALATRHGCDLRAHAADVLARWHALDLAHGIADGRLRLTRRGLAVVDALAAELPVPVETALPGSPPPGCRIVL